MVVTPTHTNNCKYKRTVLDITAKKTSKKIAPVRHCLAVVLSFGRWQVRNRNGAPEGFDVLGNDAVVEGARLDGELAPSGP